MSDHSAVTVSRCSECGAPRPKNTETPGEIFVCSRCHAHTPDTSPEEPTKDGQPAETVSPEAHARRERAWVFIDRLTALIVVLGLAQRAVFYREFSSRTALAFSVIATVLSLGAWWALHARISLALTLWTFSSVLGALAAGALLFLWGAPQNIGVWSWVSWLTGCVYALALIMARRQTLTQ